MIVHLILGIWTLIPPARNQVDLPLQPLLLSDGRELDLTGRRMRIDLPAYLWTDQAQTATLELTAGDQPADLSIEVITRLELEWPGLDHNPAEIHAQLNAGQAARFAWRLLTRETGAQNGLLWVAVQVRQGTTPIDEIALLARLVQIPVHSPLLFRIGATVGLFLGLVGGIRMSRR